MDPVLSITVLAIIVEQIVERFAPTLKAEAKPWFAAAVGVLLCLIYQADAMGALGLSSPYPFAGEVLTGLLISRGAGYLNALVKRITQPAQQNWLIEELTDQRTIARKN